MSLNFPFDPAERAAEVERLVTKDGMKAWPAVMRDLFRDEDIGRLEKLLEEFGIGARLEQEVLEEYPFVSENMKKRKVLIKS